MKIEKIEKIFNRKVKSTYIHESVLLVENTNGDFSHKLEHGGKFVDSPLLIASITELFTTTCILILKEQGKLSLKDNISKYIDNSILNELHMYKGEDYSSKLTISHLLFQTSGLPDAYEEGKDSIKKQILRKDAYFHFEEMIAITKQMKPHFAPDITNRAHYADINFDILGNIIENITNSTLEEVYNTFIFDSLRLEKTYLPKTEKDVIPSIYYKESSISRPLFIMSCRASGGAISTARELMIFLKAFFGGKLFQKETFNLVNKYHKLQMSMYPIQYGGGYMRIPLGGFATLFMGKGELIGHAGSTGSFAFYFPEKDLFIVGDVNQAANPAGIRMAMQIALSLN